MLIEVLIALALFALSAVYLVEGALWLPERPLYERCEGTRQDAFFAVRFFRKKIMKTF